MNGSGLSAGGKTIMAPSQITVPARNCCVLPIGLNGIVCAPADSAEPRVGLDNVPQAPGHDGITGMDGVKCTAANRTPIMMDAVESKARPEARAAPASAKSCAPELKVTSVEKVFAAVNVWEVWRNATLCLVECRGSLHGKNSR